MAVIEQSSYLSVKFPLKRGDEETSRTLNFPFPIDNPSTIQTQLNSLIAKYTSNGAGGAKTFPGYQYFIQPSNWRDSDTAEEAWTCDWSKITMELIETSKTSFSPTA